MTEGSQTIMKRWVVLLTFFTTIVACIQFAKTLAKFLYNLYRQHVTYEYADWAKNWVYEKKPLDLLWFCFSFALLYCCFFAWSIIYKKFFSDGQPADRLPPLSLLINAALLAIICPIANNRTVGLAGLVASALLLIGMVMVVWLALKGKIPRCPDHLPLEAQRIAKGFARRSGRYLAWLFAVAVILFSYDTLSLVFGNKLVVTNEFVEFSEKTKIDGKEYNNIDFFKTNLSYNQFKSIDEYLVADYDKIIKDMKLTATLKRLDKNKDSLESKFIKSNSYEFRWQLLNRSFDLHNNQTMNPLNAWLQGVPLDKTNNLYGLIIPGIARLYFKAVNFSYDNWLRLAFFLEWFYFISIPIAIYIGFKSREIAFAAFLLMVGMTFYGVHDGYFYFVNAQIPINPIRHGCDFLAILAFGSYLKRKNFLALSGIAATCIVAILLGDHFGLALTAASAITLFTLYVSEKRNLKDFAILLILFLVVLMSFKFSSLNDRSHTVRYFIDGFFSWSSSQIIKNLVFFYSLVYLSLFYIYQRSKAGKLWYLTLMLSLYSNMMCFHYVWHGQVSDFISVGRCVICIMLPCLIVLVMESFGREKYSAAVLATLLTIIFLPNYATFQASKSRYYRIIDSHAVYQWNLETAKFKTTMPPEYFDDSVALVHKYSPGNRGIYLLSKYDYMLPVLAGRYSKMLYPNLPYFLITTKESNELVAQLETEKPDILFVDSDIMLDGQLWTANNLLTLSNSAMFNENQLRLSRLNELKKVFQKVRGQYRLVEKGRVIDVYKRDATAIAEAQAQGGRALKAIVPAPNILN